MTEGYIVWRCPSPICKSEITTEMREDTYKQCPNCGAGMIIKKKVEE